LGRGEEEVPCEKQDDGRYFIRRQEDPFGHNLEHRRIGNILYVNLTTFGVEPGAFLAQFDKILDSAALSATAGIILDLRDNGGGNDEASFGVARRFLRTAAAGAKSKVRKYVGAWQAWGKPQEWEILESGSVPPASSPMPRYDGPLVILTGPETGSSAEDMAMVLQGAHRARLVGARTAGDTGQIISFGLPGGGLLWICTKWDFQPDGGDLIGVGLAPDVEVEAAMKDILDGRDPVLDAAIQAFKKPLSSTANPNNFGPLPQTPDVPLALRAPSSAR
jgi:carboxyl-terminal processing protease